MVSRIRSPITIQQWDVQKIVVLNSQSFSNSCASVNSLSTPVQFVKGVGPAVAVKLERLGIITVADLLSFLPVKFIDRRVISKISDLIEGKDRTISGKVIRSGVAFLGGRKRIFEVILSDDTGFISLKWFRFQQKSYEARFKIGAQFIVSGEVSFFRNIPQIVHPETESSQGYEIPPDSNISGKILPVYPATEGLSQRQIRKIIHNAWEKYSQYVEPHFPSQLIDEYDLLHPRESLEQLHYPSNDTDIKLLEDRNSHVWKSLIFDEFFFVQLGLSLKKSYVQMIETVSFPRSKNLHDEFISTLPFELTNAQKRVIEELRNDLARSRPMNRLLQGDVGSGKTIVSLIAALQVIDAGYQVALMAPTEILANQHYRTIEKFKKDLPFGVTLLTGSVKEGEKRDIRDKIKSGETSFIIGTHALIQESVDFSKLGFIIIDEQHRFGVRQRAALKDKGIFPHTLIMTATPIPRTLAMTLYGDLDISIIDELPKGRTPIISKLYSENQRSRLLQGMEKILKQGRQIYVVCPLIEESEKVDLKAATIVCDSLKQHFAPRYNVDLLHGRMKGELKDETMQSFADGKIDVLVTTTVVEVGVDVANATAMIIEHAERFGLSQLHQLRGRVGRGDEQSYCIFMTDYRQSEVARQRLKVMIDSNDGFRIAEEDLKIRGPGEFIGTRQSGLPAFRVANLTLDGLILNAAKEASQKILDKDPHLAHPDHHKIRETLKIRWKGNLNLAEVG
ncbi:MAG: ATP-dependent DNA helicase RecG [Pseudomonadota bacterium]